MFVEQQIFLFSYIIKKMINLFKIGGINVVQSFDVCISWIFEFTELNEKAKLWISNNLIQRLWTLGYLYSYLGMHQIQVSKYWIPSNWRNKD